MSQALAPQMDLTFSPSRKVGVDNDFIETIKSFDRIGQQTEIFHSDGLDYYVNDYWTASQRQSNRLHEISYRACFKAELPEFFIKRLTQAGDVIYDPFMGRGTTPLQASLMGRRAYGNDINPLSKMLIAPRLAPPTLPEIAKRLDSIDWSSQYEVDETLLAFYHPQTLQRIYALKAHFAGRKLDKIDNWIRMIALNRLTGHSSGFFSVYTLPPNQAVSAKRQAKINMQRQQIPPEREVKSIILKKSKTLLSQVQPFEYGDVKLGTAPADDTSFVPDSAVDLVVTSPPFLDVVQYAQDNWLRCWFADIDADAVPISMCKNVEDWTDFTHNVLQELTRIVKRGGYIAYEVGEVRGGKILLEHYVAQAAHKLPLEVLGVIVNQQKFTKTANCWGVKNNNKGTNSNRIVVMRRM
ncbi:MAG: site-specific DNA-methyltransferase, partial [Alphaproteobacteria bacterium]|nr:site-specific DNA-methyltransferase [Alphaproteobacteria bacterium]